MSILQDIFKDHYEEMIYTLHPRLSAIENVDKMIGCGDPAFGGAMYGCPHCGKLKFVPFRCHSRFCPTCGNLYAMQRTTSISFKLVNVSHRHCVFTIDEQLRGFFLQDRSLLDCLFHAVNSVVFCCSNVTVGASNPHKHWIPQSSVRIEGTFEYTNPSVHLSTGCPPWIICPSVKPSPSRFTL